MEGGLVLAEERHGGGEERGLYGQKGLTGEFAPGLNPTTETGKSVTWLSINTLSQSHWSIPSFSYLVFSLLVTRLWPQLDVNSENMPPLQRVSETQSLSFS
jgi:hypothetical protein